MLKHFTISEKARLAISFGLAFFLLLILYIQSNGLVEGGQDSYNHFLISKYAFKYPNMLLDQWGKPVYTLIAHPFCFLGLSFSVWLNISCTLLSGLICALIAKKIGLTNYWTAFWVCIFAPIALGNTISSLTEPLNMLMLSGAFYLWLIDKRIAATLLFSFMPWIRTEGFVIIVPFLTYLIIYKHYKLIPLLLSATVIFNCLGWAQTGDPFWFITNNPYFLVETEAERFAPEGGNILYYAKNNKAIFGNLIILFASLGSLIVAQQYITKKKLSFIFWVIVGIFVAYYFAHSFIIWKGMLGTHGMTRVMMVIVPSVAICFNLAIHFISEKINSKKFPIGIITGCILIFSTFNAYKNCGYPTKFWNLKSASVKPIANLKNLQKAQSFLNEKGLSDRVIYHQIPIYNVLYNKDPFAKPLSPNWRVENIWSIDHENNWAPKSSLILWDGYHAQREGSLPYEKIKNWNSYKLLAKFADDSTKVGPHDFHIYEKID